MRTSDRSRKLSTEIKKVLPIIIRPLLDPALFGIITITDLELSGDLGIAKVFVSQIGGSQNPVPKLQKMHKKISHELAKTIKTRRTIVFRFQKDKTNDILQKLA